MERDDQTVSQRHLLENAIFTHLEQPVNRFTTPLQHQLPTPRTDPGDLHLYADILGQFNGFEPPETFALEELHTQASEFSSFPPEFMVPSNSSFEINSPSNTHFLPESIPRNAESSSRYQTGQAEGSWQFSQPVNPFAFPVPSDFVQSERSAVVANTTILESDPFEANIWLTSDSNILTQQDTHSGLEKFCFGNSQLNFDANGQFPLTRVSASTANELPTTVNIMQENELFATASKLLSTSCVDSRQPKRGNNIHGRKGIKKCRLCRKHRSKVIRP